VSASPENTDGNEGDRPEAGAADESTAEKVNAATALIRAGFEPDAALKAVGLSPIKHKGLLPVTLKVDGEGVVEPS
jgi:hypothetical protein